MKTISEGLVAVITFDNVTNRRDAMPNTRLQMLLRAQNVVGCPIVRRGI
jgi:pyruvate carboxylase